MILRHRPTGVTAEASSQSRSQADNRRVALARLRLRLAIGYREAPLPTRRRFGNRVSATIGSSSRSTMTTIRSWRKPSIGSPPSTSTCRRQQGPLRVTPSQLVRLLAKEPSALARSMPPVGTPDSPRR